MFFLKTEGGEKFVFKKEISEILQRIKKCRLTTIVKDYKLTANLICKQHDVMKKIKWKRIRKMDTKAGRKVRQC